VQRLDIPLSLNFMKRAFILLLLVLSAFSDFGKEKKGENSLNISFTTQYYFNKLNLDNRQAYQPIRPHNSIGCNLGISYGRITKRRFMMEYGLEMGFQAHPITITQDLTNFDPDAVNTLKGEIINDKHTYITNYYSCSSLFGYSIPAIPDWPIDVKAGGSIRIYRNSENFSRPYFINETYQTDDHTQIRVAEIFFINPAFGNDSHIFKIYERLEPMWGLHLGTHRNINKKWLHQLFFGLSFTKNFFKLAENYMRLEYNTSWQSLTTSIPQVDEYNARNISVGIKIGVGLWR
jgi:hypothetical protein